MPIEHETQVLNIDVPALSRKLRDLGAQEEAEVLQKRWVFDLRRANYQGPGTGEWIRLRQSGTKTTLTYKHRPGTGIDQTEEIETTVADFEETAEILGRLPCFTAKYYQENKRIRFTLNNLEFTLDTWPRIPPLLEIEGPSQAEIAQGLQMVGLANKDIGHLGMVEIYKKYGLDLHDFPVLKF